MENLVVKVKRLSTPTSLKKITWKLKGNHIDTSAWYFSGTLSVQNLIEFTMLWSHTSQFDLCTDAPDSIVWKLTTNGAYSCSSAYKAQFAGTIHSCMDSIVWKAWAPPKCKLFAWLIIQNRVWTTDRLAKWGWPNGRVCPYADAMTNPPTTSSSNVGSRFAFGR
jgi:hypothetical protein